MTFRQAKRIMDECRALGVKAVRFTGGEPLLNKQLGYMLAYAKKCGFYILLNTNATMINNTSLRLLAASVDNILISLQGFNQKAESRLTGSQGGFKEKVANITRLITRIPRVRVGTVISKTLLANLHKYYHLLKGIGIENWELYRPIIASGNGEFNIGHKELRSVMRSLYDLKEKGMKVRIANPVPFCINKKVQLSLATLLGAIADDGHSRIVWDARGYFKPSYFIDKDLGHSVKRSWQNPFIRELRSVKYLAGKCKGCNYLKWCKGGSRAMAKKVRDDYFSVDPLLDKQGAR